MGLDPCARRLAGSPRLASPKGGPTGGDSLAGGSGPDIQLEDKGQGTRDKGQGTRTAATQHDWFLGDRTPGGGIDLRAGGCALCVCSPLTLL